MFFHLWGRCFITSICVLLPRTPSFSIELVKTKSDFIVKSVETGLGIRMLVVTVISVNAYSFLVLSDLTCHLEDAVIGVFFAHCTETELGSSEQEASLAARKNTGIVLVPCLT